MTARNRIGLLCGVGCLLAAALLICGALPLERRPPMRFSIAFATMGTRAGFTFFTTDRVTSERAFKAAQREFDRVAAACNLYDRDSELSRLNLSAHAAPFHCSELLWGILSAARRACEFSCGAFDVSVKPLMDLWGFYRKRGNTAPSAAEIEQVRRVVGLDKVIFDDGAHTVRFKVPGMALDLGGIAKGYAADLAAAAAERAGVVSGIIDLGGNLRLLPEPPPGRDSYRIAVADPDAPGQTFGKLLERPGHSALATSGDYERFVILGGKRYGHIVDPATGSPPEPGRAVTVTAPDAVTADWLSTSVYLRGAGLARRARLELPGVNIMIYHRKITDERHP